MTDLYHQNPTHILTYWAEGQKISVEINFLTWYNTPGCRTMHEQCVVKDPNQKLVFFRGMSKKQAERIGAEWVIPKTPSFAERMFNSPRFAGVTRTRV